MRFVFCAALGWDGIDFGSLGWIGNRLDFGTIFIDFGTN